MHGWHQNISTKIKYVGNTEIFTYGISINPLTHISTQH